MTRVAIDRATLEELCADAGIESPRWDYSGRGTFGRACFGFVGSVRDLAVFFYYLGAAEATGNDVALGALLVSDLRTDDMGLNTIFYFPSLEVT